MSFILLLAEYRYKSDKMWRIPLYALVISLQMASSLIVRPNVGVILMPQEVPQTATLHWHHTFAIPLSVTAGLNVTDPIHCSHFTPTCQSFITLQNSMYEAYNRMTNQLNSTKNEIVALMSHSQTDRNKRGWLNIIGKGAKSLFGVATEEDVNILKQHISKLQKMMTTNDKDRITDVKQLHSFQIQASDRMDHLAKHLTSIDDVLINISKEIRKITIPPNYQDKLLRKAINIISWNSNSTVQLLALAELTQTFTSLLHDIPHLIEGKLTSNIVFPSTLDEVLQTIDREMRTMNYHFQPACDSAYFYKHKHAVISTLQHDHIFIKLKVPLLVPLLWWVFCYFGKLPK